MAKLNKLTDIKVVDTKTGEETNYKTTTSPWKNNVGNTLLKGLNYKGMQKVQDKGIMITDDDTFVNFCIGVFKQLNVTLETSDFNRSEAWRTPEARTRFKVYMDGNEFCPPLSVKALKAAEENMVTAQTPEVAIADMSAIKVPELQVAQPVAPVVAPVDTDAVNVAKIVQYKAKGFSNEKIMAGLKTKYTEAKAKELIAKATPTVVPTVSF